MIKQKDDFNKMIKLLIYKAKKFYLEDLFNFEIKLFYEVNFWNSFIRVIIITFKTKITW